MMTYKVKLHPKVHSFLEKSDKPIQDRIRKRLLLLECDEPFRYIEHYEGEGCYKFRIGDYRALIDVDIAKKIIFVRVLDIRGRIYKQQH